MDRPALRKRNRLVTVRLGTEECSDLIKDKAEPRSGGEGFEPAHRPKALLDSAMILLQMILQIAVGPVRHPVPKDVPNSAGVGLLAIGGDAVWDDAGHDPGRAEEGLGCREVPRIAEACVKQRAVSVNGTVEIAPAPLDSDVGILS
jgi:hypothetical protein